ncbi:MAG: TRM11 family SAM-dependent methyltransferase [Actinomycetes bacterium]
MTAIDLDRAIDDVLVLDTVPGGVDYLAQELRELAEGRVQVAQRGRDYLVVRYAGPLRCLARGRLYSSCSVAIPAGGSGDRLAVLRDRLDESLRTGALSALVPSRPPLRFRVGPIGEDRWPVRDALVEHYGWANEPSNWDINLDLRSGSLRAEIGPLFLTSRFGELARLPASTTPVIAGIMCRLAKLRTGDVVLDPMCGAGTLLVVAAGSASLARLIGCDISRRAVRDAATNLARLGIAGTVLQADAVQLPLQAASVDRVLTNLPFGKRLGSHHDNVELYPRMLRELTRVLTRQGRAVLLTEDKALFRQSVQRTPNLHEVRELVLGSGGAHPSAFVLARTRGRR